MVEGSTDSYKFQLLDAGVPIDLSNITLTLLLEDRTGVALASNWVLSITDFINGRVTFTPTSTTLLVATAGPYFARWKLVSITTGNISYVPSSIRDVWNIVGV